MQILPTEPPRCLRAFTLEQVTVSDAGLMPDAAFNAYRLCCNCQSRLWKLKGNGVDDNNTLDDPIDVECIRCHKRYRLFDSHVDGYDAENGITTISPPIEESLTWQCPRCHATYGELVVAVGYQYEAGEALKTPSDLANHFDALLVWHRCGIGNTGAYAVIAECA